MQLQTLLFALLAPTLIAAVPAAWGGPPGGWSHSESGQSTGLATGLPTGVPTGIPPFSSLPSESISSGIGGPFPTGSGAPTGTGAPTQFGPGLKKSHFKPTDVPTATATAAPLKN